MKVELTKKDIENLLNMINATGFKGDSVEMVYELKKKLKDAKNRKT
ncbi:MAG: hypothetical protein ACYS30_26000 [Planctomycetota bacterium]|jgi:hypothetical protein